MLDNETIDQIARRVADLIGGRGDGKLAFGISEAADLAGISRSLMYDLVNRGEIESFHVGTRRLIARDALVRFIDQRSRLGV